MRNTGVDLGAKDALGANVLHAAVKVHNVHIVKHILTKTLRKKTKLKERLLNEPDLLGNTAVHSATGGASWHAGLSKALMFDTEATFTHHTVFNNPAWHKGFTNDCLERFQEQADLGGGTFGEVSKILSDCGFFSTLMSLLLKLSLIHI